MSDSADIPPSIDKLVLAWAEFLYEEFIEYKHKQLLSDYKHKKIKARKRGNND